jgi:hypothetical protein
MQKPEMTPGGSGEKKPKTDTNTMSRTAIGCLVAAGVLLILSINDAVDHKWPEAFYMVAWAFFVGTVGRQLLFFGALTELALPLLDQLTDRLTDRVLERTKPGTNSPGPGPGTGYTGRRE